MAQQLLAVFGIEVFGYVVQLESIPAPPRAADPAELRALRDASPLYTLCPEVDARLRAMYAMGASPERLARIYER